MSNRAMDDDDVPDPGPPPRQMIGHPRPQRPGIFRRRMILQLTSLLDLLLIIVFVQYLEMQQISGRAIAREAARRRQAEAGLVDIAQQRDLLLKQREHNLYDVWVFHINGDNSAYPDGSVLVTSATRKKLLLADSGDFALQIIEAMKGTPRPKNPCVMLLTWGDISFGATRSIKNLLQSAASDQRLQSAWGQEPINFVVVDGDFVKDAQ